MLVKVRHILCVPLLCCVHPEYFVKLYSDVAACTYCRQINTSIRRQEQAYSRVVSHPGVKGQKTNR